MALHRALDGQGPVPLTLLLARLCEAWHVPPSVAFREYLSLPAGMAEEILEAHEYARAKAIYDAARSERDLPESEWIDWVKVIDFELMRQRRAARGEADGVEDPG
jgi:hypothetical protein